MIKYEDDRKFAYFNNVKYIRDEKTKYYLSTTKVNNKRIRLHRAVYIFYKGEIQKGYQIHHKDHDKNNNEVENLVLIKNGKHQSLHGEENSNNEEWLKWARNNLEKNVRPKASEWHGSKEGIEWHRKHYEKHCREKFSKKILKKCKFCSNEYLGPDRSNDKFCSNKCKSAWRRKSGIDNETKICEYCKKEFTVNKYYKQKLCSKSCSNREYPRKKLKI